LSQGGNLKKKKKFVPNSFLNAVTTVFHVLFTAVSSLQKFYKIPVLNQGVAGWSFKGIDFVMRKALAGFLTSHLASDLNCKWIWVHRGAKVSIMSPYVLVVLQIKRMH